LGRGIGVVWAILAAWILVFWATAGGVAVDLTSKALPWAALAAVAAGFTLIAGPKRTAMLASTIAALFSIFIAWPIYQAADASFRGGALVSLLLSILIATASAAILLWDSRGRRH